MVKLRVATLIVVALSLLSACGDAYTPLKAKQNESEVATSAVSTVAPTADAGWTLRAYDWQTAHPYKAKTTQVFTITEPGAKSIRVHFGAFQLENGYDWLVLSTPEGTSRIAYTGKLGDFWSSEIPGATVRLEFTTDASIQKPGFSVVGYAARPDGEQWNTKPFVWETAHPYADDAYQTIEISQPGAVKMKVLFGDLDLEDGYDFVRVYDAVGRQVAQYTGTQMKFETPAFAGDHLWVVFASDESITRRGASVAQYSYVMPAGEPGCMHTDEYNPVCGENGKTYSNQGAAHCEGIAVKHFAACGSTGDFCGGIGNVNCAQGFTCQLSGSWPDAGGACTQ